ncbi:MAG: TRAP transporter TatT component family protein [Pyrinomonadaceae bacterium]
MGSQAAKPPPATETLTKAEQLFSERKDLSKLREAIGILQRARVENLRSYDVEWKFARYNYFLARHTDDEKERERSFEAGKAAGKIAMQMEPNRPEGYFWYGANLGEQADRGPIMVGLKSVDEIRAAMNKVIELQPDFELASPYDVLGKIELQTRLMGGNTEKALKYLEKALALEKNNGDIRIHLAEAYLAQKKEAEAKQQLEFVLHMTPHPEYIVEYEEQVGKAKLLLSTKF